MIWFLLKLLYTKWLNITRWSNFPRIENVSPLDNTWFVIHIALFLCYLEEQNWEKIDREYIIKKILFDIFSSLILSDINSWTRDYISNIDNSVLDKINKKIFDYILSFEWWDFLKKDFTEIISATNKNLENNIILAAKKFAWYNECLVNSKVFVFTYDVVLEEIEAYLEYEKDKLYSLKILLENDNYKKYLSHIRRLSYCKRWSWIKRNYEVSVMSHLVMVTFISYILGNYENQNNKNYNVYDMMIKSLYHDIPEAITWDIITPTKKSIEWFRKTLEKVEKQMLNDYFFVYIWDDYKNQIKDYMLNPFDDYEWKLTKNADIICALFEAKIEADSWNPEFDNIYKKLKKTVNDFDLISSDHFLKEILMDFEEDFSNVDFNE